MLKLIYGLYRLPALTRVQFNDHWQRVHAPLVRERAALLGILRYVQCHTVDDSRLDALTARSGGTGFDGVAELWFDPAQLVANHDNPLAQRAGRELYLDEQRFIDFSRSVITIAQEHEVVPCWSPGTGVST
jgi:hypothetical protein